MQTARRDLTIDLAKGIAIVAIVLGHVLRGLSSSGIVDGSSTTFITTDRLLYTFHLSVFAFLAALFIRRAVDRDGVWGYLRSRDALFIYLYVLWSVLQGAVKLLTGALVNSPTSVADVLRLWIPEGQLWFLPWLIVMTTVVVLTRPWRSISAAVIMLVASAAVSVALWGLSGAIAGTQGLGLTVFFFAGAVIESHRMISASSRVSSLTAGLLAVLGIGVMVAIVLTTSATPSTMAGDTRTVLTVSLGVVASVAGVVGVLALARLLAPLGVPVAWLAFVGERTLEIFLAHIIAASGTRIALGLASVESPAVNILAGTVAGILLPLALWWVTERIRFPWLFAAPTKLTGK